MLTMESIRPRFITTRTLLAAMVVLTVLSGSAFRTEARGRDDRLAEARRDWLIGVATEKRIAAELAKYKSSDQPSPEIVQLYETYLDRVRRLTEEKRLVLEKLENQRGSAAASVPSSNRIPDKAPAAAYDPAIPEDQELDETRALNQELDRSLAAFDDMLLREIEQSRVQSELKMRKLAQEAARAAKSLQEQGQMQGSAETESGVQEGQSSDGAGNETGDRDAEREGAQEGAQGAMGDKDAASNQQATGGGADLARSSSKQQQGPVAGESGQAGDAGNLQTQDDDIVARQLREAAEKETDPELKEKLWKEYRDYKKRL
jgi:hypothetical protein